MLDNEQLNALANIVDTTWGKSSTANVGARHLYAVKCQIVGENMTITYSTLVTFAGEQSFRMQKPKYDEESNKILKDCLADIKKMFKEDTGSALTTKELSSTTDLELLSNPANPSRTACFRRKTVVSLNA